MQSAILYNTHSAELFASNKLKHNNIIDYTIYTVYTRYTLIYLFIYLFQNASGMHQRSQSVFQKFTILSARHD